MTSSSDATTGTTAADVRTNGPWRGCTRRRFTRGMFVGDEVMLDISIPSARARLESLTRGGLLISASDDAYAEEITGLMRVGPAGLSRLVRHYRAAYARAPQARIMGERARLVGLRRDGATLPVEISLSPVPTATGHLILAVVRDATDIRRREDLAELARAISGS